MSALAPGGEFDLVGIGFGPSGIALACALEDDLEANGTSRLGAACFLERGPDSAWQRDMLLRETDIQHHFLRDLATPRNPRSRFTFANYLKEKGRLYEFGELLLGAAGGAVSRLEWSDYLVWAAGLLHRYARYNEEVLGLEPLEEAGAVERLRVITPRGAYVARRLVCCSGRAPEVPEPFRPELSSRLFHSATFRSSIEAADPGGSWRFAVIGSGQSAAEVLLHLHGAFPASSMLSIHRSLGFRHVDLCQFSNEVFHPEEVDFFHPLSAALRYRAFVETIPTNYGVIDAQAADSLYRKMYEDRVVGERRIEMIKRSEVVGVERRGEAYRLRLRNLYTGRESALEADYVVLCTGHREEVFPKVLEPLRPWIVLDGDGGPVVERDYRVRAIAELSVPVYLSGMSERTHGPSDSASFSMVALRAERLLEAMLHDRAREPRVPSAAM